MIEAIFFDIDGTLISFKNHTIPESTIKALYKLHKKGIKIFIATGRDKKSLATLQKLPFDGFITLNGQYCFSKDKVLYENAIASSDIHSLLAYLDKKTIACGMISEDEKYFNIRNERVEELHKITKNDGNSSSNLHKLKNQKIYQCMLFVDEIEENEIMKLLPNCISSRWHHLFCDVSPKGGTKQKGIDQFLAHFDIDLTKTMAFGDGGNDISMLEHVAIGVAMGNASKEVKAIADYVTDDVDNDGIVKALQYFGVLTKGE